MGFEGEFAGGGDLPRFDKLVDGVSLALILNQRRPAQVVIEKVGAMPGQGVSSMFTFGAAYGVCIGAVCGYGAPLAYVTPVSWKRHFRLTGKPKDAARELAIRLYPNAVEFLKRKKDHGLADAILLARYALDMDAGAKFA